MAPRVYPATVTGIHDGDSLTVLADLGFDVWRRVTIRLAGMNANELAAPGGAQSRDHLKALLPLGSSVTLTAQHYDKYGNRVDALITMPDGRDVSTVMIADGFAAAWDGTGVKPTVPAS